MAWMGIGGVCMTEHRACVHERTSGGCAGCRLSFHRWALEGRREHWRGVLG